MSNPPIVLEENSKIRHIASLRTKDPDTRFFLVIVEHEPSRVELNLVVDIPKGAMKEIQKTTYSSFEQAIGEYHKFRSQAINQMQEQGIELVYSEYHIQDMTQDQQIQYIQSEFASEMGFKLQDKRGKL